MINFLATLGWNDGTEQEVFSVDELIDKFSLDRVQKSPARFDEKRLVWLNGQWIRQLSDDEIYKRVQDFWPETAEGAEENYKKNILRLAQDRMKTLSDLPLLTSYFFDEPTPDWSMIQNDKYVGKLSTDEVVSLLNSARETLSACPFDEASIQQALNDLLESTGQKPAVLFSIIRLAVSWAPFSPALNETLATLGKETSLNRLTRAIDAAPGV
jgi:glutamyl/glutaminyl-tRNA synthetase